MLRIEFKTGNAAFRDDDGNLDRYEVAYFLMKRAEKIADAILNADANYGTLRDINGNRVGEWTLED